MDHGYAEVYPDTRVLDFNRRFDYKIPAHLTGRIKTGSIVSIPLKNREETGYVCRLKKYSSLKDGDLKFINDVFGDIEVFDISRLRLIHWMCAYYIQPFGKIAELFLPPLEKAKLANTLKNPEQSLKHFTMLSLNHFLLQDFEKKQGYSRLSKQKAIIDYIKSCGQAEKKQMLDKINPSISSLRGLIKSGIIIEKKVRLPYCENQNPGFFENEPGSSGANAGNANISFKDFNGFFKNLSNEISSGVFKAYMLKGLSFKEKAMLAEMIIGCAAENAKKTLFCVPESAEAERFFESLKDCIKKQTCVYHSDKNPKARFEDWYDTYKNRYTAIIGTRSSVFLPIKNAGAIILFEEQNSSYKDSSIIRYNTVDIVLKLGKILKIPIVFLSDAPSVKTMHLFSSANDFLIIDKKPGQKAENQVKKEIVDLKKIDSYKDDVVITKTLHKYIIETSSKKENTLIFANRRGFSSFVTCKKCGNTPKCPNCDISYSFHNDRRILICHHCFKRIEFKGICEKCGGRDFLYKGNGIESIELKIKKRFPDLPLLRIDSDSFNRSTDKKNTGYTGGVSSPLIILGTRKMLSCLKLENVSLAAITDFDSLIQLPDFHVNERAFQVMDKIISFLKKDGRSRFVVQAYNIDNTVIKNFIYNDYDTFYKEELKNRQELDYPPYSSLINIIISGKDEKAVIKDIESIYSKLNNISSIDLKILGPSPAPYFKINLNYRWHMLLKTHDLLRLCIKISRILKSFNKNEKNKIITDVDPAWIL